MNLAVTLETVGIGVTSFMNQALAGQTLSDDLLYRALNVVSRILGPGVAKAIAPENWNGDNYKLKSYLPQKINPFGAFNGTTFAGIGLFIADAIIEYVGGSRFGYSKVRRFILGAGTGLTAGGILGGIFDDNGRIDGGGLSRNPVMERVSGGELNPLTVRTQMVMP